MMDCPRLALPFDVYRYILLLSAHSFVSLIIELLCPACPLEPICAHRSFLYNKKSETLFHIDHSDDGGRDIKDEFTLLLLLLPSQHQFGT